MPAPTKPYTFSNTPTNTNIIDADQVNADFDTLYGYLQAGVDTLSAGTALANLGANSVPVDKLADAAKLGISGASAVRRGAVSIATNESRTNTAYGTLTTPDKVASIVLPSNGLIVVAYQATWQESVANAARAAIFIGSNQLKYPPGASSAGGVPLVQEASTQSAAQTAQDTLLGSCATGLTSAQLNSGTAYTGDVTTGQVVGAWAQNGLGGVTTPGPCHIFAAAGTYDVSVQFKATSGTVAAKNRTLRVWTIGF